MKTGGFEIGHHTEVTQRAKTSGQTLSKLEQTVNRFDGTIGKASFQEGDNAAPMFLNAHCQLAKGLKPAELGALAPPAQRLLILMAVASLTLSPSTRWWRTAPRGIHVMAETPGAVRDAPFLRVRNAPNSAAEKPIHSEESRSNPSLLRRTQAADAEAHELHLQPGEGRPSGPRVQKTPSSPLKKNKYI